MKIYNHSDILEQEKYFRRNFMNTVSGYKSAHLLATTDKNGQTNVAVFNSVVHIGATPPHIGFIMRPLTVERQTYNNIKATGKFTLNAVTVDIHEKAHQTSAKYPADISEFDACQLEAKYLNDFPIPFVGESPIKIGLSLAEEIEIKTNGTILIVGKVETIIIDDQIISESGHIDLEKMNGVAISGLDTYYKGAKLGTYAFARPNQSLKKV